MSHTLSLINPFQAIGVGLIAVGLYWLGRCIYLLYFHPLAKYPGPKVAAITDLWWVWMITSGRGPQILVEAHKKYGDVIRICPNQLSFTSPQSYQDIYGHVSKGRGRFLKTDFYDSGKGLARITAVRDPEAHARQRKALSHAFSAKALREQESLIQQYVELFIKQLGALGDLSFGESFEGVAQGRTHYWVSIILDGVRFQQLQSVQRQVPFLGLAMRLLAPKGSAEKYRTLVELSLGKARRRLAMGGDSPHGGVEDFFGHMIRKGTIEEGEMMEQARTLIVAGSETTAATLTCATYLLLRNQEALARLCEEVRGAFTAADQITGDSTAGLAYLHGVIEEALRLWPPVAITLPRYSPGATIDGHYVPAGVTVGNSNYEMSRDPRYWQNPDAFRPERWVPGGGGDEKRASQPFSTGPRACLGINLAYLELRIIIAKVIFEYDLELRPELLVKFHRVHRGEEEGNTTL
ncbi:cytochrome P450 [Xylariales sp. PMI_506]|nr:cytochrome P450 [Xylariales sp. PMI_506]